MKYFWLKRLNKLVIFLIFTCLATIAYGQVTVTGKVIDKRENKPVVGATVQVKNTSVATTTDENGNFSLKAASSNVTLVVTYVGFATQEVKLNNNKSITISLEDAAKSMEDVVVIGYQSVQRKTTSAALSSVKGKDFENTPYPTFDQMLQGRVAGLNVLNISGEPGANNIVNIRGSSTVLDPNIISAPLYVIDGVVFDVSDQRVAFSTTNPLSAINPNDIESIDVLKDASAAAIYGARAANGVIIVKTKRPKGGPAQIKVSSYVGISDRPAMKPMIVGAAERRMKMDLLTAAPYASLANLSLFLTDSLNPAFNNNTDFQGLFLQQALIHNVDASIAAMGDKFSYRLSFNKYYEDGVMRGYDFARTSPRISITAKPTPKLDVTTDLFVTFSKQKHGPGNATGTASRYGFSIWGFPSSFWKISDQDLQNYSGRNDKVYDDDRTTSLVGNSRAIYKILPDLILTSSFSYNFGMNRRDYLLPANINGGRSDAINYVSSNRRWELENYLTYNKTFNKHSVSVLLGQGSEEQVNYLTNARGNGIAIEAIRTIQGVPAGSGLTASSLVEERARLSLFTRMHYDYQGKYGVDLSLRGDGSSRYGSNNRWGKFPAVSGMWIVSKEDFFQPVSNVVNFLKFRASYGVTGRDPGGYYAQYISLTNNAAYTGASLGAGGGSITTYNGTVVVYPGYGTTTSPGTAAAPTISWERAPQSNYGLDMSLFKDRISLSADYYIKDSKSSIFDVNTPITTGFSKARNNYVDLRNTGVEFTLTTQNLSPRSAFRWSTNLNVAFNNNYITKLPQGNRDFKFGPSWLTRTLTIGQPSFSFLVWDNQGIYANTSDVPVDPLTGRRLSWGSPTGNQFSAGDPIRLDKNGDYVIDDFDKINLGSPNTKVQGGFINQLGYKNFQVSVLCSFISGRKLWNGYLSDKMQDAGSSTPWSVWGPFSGPASDFKDAHFWSYPGDVAQYPALITNNVDKWHIGQSLYVEDASFFRVKNIMLSYSLPSNLMKRLKITGVRVYSSLDNVWVYSNSNVPDPEAVQPDGYSSGNDYPLPKKMTIGLEVNF
jgi:TonB-dependent starch-binding outer membrane protein SusC